MTASKVRSIIDLIELNHLKDKEYDSIYRICLKYYDVFQHPDDPLVVTNLYKETITLQKEARPVHKKPFRLPHSQKKVIDEEIAKLLKNDIIEPAKSPLSSPLLVVPKKADINGEKKWRVVIDFRDLNDRIIGDKFPLPQIT